MQHDPIKAKIISLVPEIADRPSGFSATGRIASPAITLADVLRAIHDSEHAYSYFVDITGDFWIWNDIDETPRRMRKVWNLTTDYDGQTDEVKEFIGKLLGV